jgi:hypothetical protein
VGDDHGRFAKKLVAADVLDVAVGVDDDLRGALAEGGDGLSERLGVFARLGIDEASELVV